VIGPIEERSLIESIDATELSSFRFQGWLGKRLLRLALRFRCRALRPCGPDPDWLFSLRERAATFARLKPDDLAQALLIRYDPGAGIGWHRDRPTF